MEKVGSSTDGMLGQHSTMTTEKRPLAMRDKKYQLRPYAEA